MFPLVLFVVLRRSMLFRFCINERRSDAMSIIYAKTDPYDALIGT